MFKIKYFYKTKKSTARFGEWRLHCVQCTWCIGVGRHVWGVGCGGVGGGPGEAWRLAIGRVGPRHAHGARGDSSRRPRAPRRHQWRPVAAVARGRGTGKRVPEVFLKNGNIQRIVYFSKDYCQALIKDKSRPKPIQLNLKRLLIVKLKQ